MCSAFGAIPVICIGQASVDLGLAVNRLSKRLDFPASRLLLFADDVDQASPDQLLRPTEPPRSSKSSKSAKPDGASGQAKFAQPVVSRCSLPPCCHGVLEPDMTCDVCRAKTERVFEACGRFLDSFESLRQVVVLCELHSAFGLWTYDQVLDFLDCYELECPLCTLLLKPAIPPCGAENIFSVCVAAKALEYSSLVLLRGVDEFLVELESDKASSASSDAEDAFELLACDVWALVAEHDGALFDEGQYALWPAVFATSSCKLIDVRSSISRTFSALEKQKRPGSKGVTDLKPARLLCSNVHRLHLCYLSRYPSMLLPNDKISSSPDNPFACEDTLLASCVGVLVDRQLQKNCFVSLRTVTDGDVTPMLHWATKANNSWTLLEESEIVPLFKANNRTAVKTPTSAQIPIAILVMESIYAKFDLQLYCKRSKELLCLGAYRKNFGENKYLSHSVISDMLTVLESHLYL